MESIETGEISSAKLDASVGFEAAADLGNGTAGKIFCANCIHCKLVPSPAGGSGTYYLRVRCDAGKWLKKLGEEKIHKYFTVARRSIESCASYEDMGDAPEFLKDLRKTLPAKDEIYLPAEERA